MQAVCGEAKAFENGGAYVVRVEPEPRPPNEVEYHFYAVRKKAIPDHWPLVIGDAIQNFRHSLDHAVYTAAKGKGRTQFPIFEDACEFQVKGRKDIKAAPTSIQAIIEQAQPFNTVIGHPASDVLAVLADLSNFDKHRDITAMASYVELPWLSHDGLLPGQSLRATYTAEGKPLGDEDTQVMSFILSGPKADQMKVYPGVAYEVRIERVRRNKRTIDRIGLVTTLEHIAMRVADVIEAVEMGRPPSVWLRPAAP